jgi:hypothetical protein
VYSVYADHASKPLCLKLPKKLTGAGIPPEDAELYKGISYEAALKLAIDYSDGVVISHKEVSSGIRAHIAKSNKPTLVHQENRYGSRYLELYRRVCE